MGWRAITNRYAVSSDGKSYRMYFGSTRTRYDTAKGWLELRHDCPGPDYIHEVSIPASGVTRWQRVGNEEAEPLTAEDIVQLKIDLREAYFALGNSEHVRFSEGWIIAQQTPDGA